MRTLSLIVAAAVAGCATTLPESAPNTLKASYSAMYEAMRYDYKTEYSQGLEVWTSGCPKVGDCEDVALCLVEQLRKRGAEPELQIYSWKSGKVPWSHVMAKADGVLMDYYGLFWNPNERVTLTATCRQLTHTEGKPAYSTAGLWQCTRTNGAGSYMRMVK